MVFFLLRQFSQRFFKQFSLQNSFNYIESEGSRPQSCSAPSTRVRTTKRIQISSEATQRPVNSLKQQRARNLAEENRVKVAKATLTEAGLQDDDADIKTNVQKAILCDLAIAEADIGCLRAETSAKY